MAEFRIPNKILYGEGTAAYLGGIRGQRLLLVCDNPVMEQQVRRLLAPSGITVRTFVPDTAHIHERQVLDGAKALMEFKPDWVLAAGGHGAMDLAKLIRILYQRPDITIDEIIRGKAQDIALSKTKFIALPLFNTNGAEATCTAHLCDDSHEFQHEIRNPYLMPDVTVLDPELLCCCDERQEALGIMSALILAVESASVPDAGIFPRPLAVEALRIIAENVPAHSLLSTARPQLLYAQCLAGIAYTNSTPGLCSVLCRASAMCFGVQSLGNLGAIYLPQIIRKDSYPEKYLPAATAMGLNHGTELASMIQEYADILGLPLYLKEMGVNKNTFLKKLSKISHNVLSVFSHANHMDSDTKKDIEQILRAAYYSKE